MAEARLRGEIEKIIRDVVTESVDRIMPLLSAGAGRRPGYDCTGNSFGCDTYYICDNNNHSCKTDTSFNCGGDFSCTGGAFGIVVEAARPRQT